MLTKKSIWVAKPKSNIDFGLRIDEGDKDGFLICETKGDEIVNQVYSYYSEREVLIGKLQEISDNGI